MNTKTLALLFGVALVLVAIFLLLPRHRCGDESDVVLQGLTDRATSGDLVAIATLYKLAKDNGVRPLQEYWAFRGAMEGDALFRKQYGEFYAAFQKEEKERVLQTIRKDMNHPGARCLLASLSGEAATDKCAP